MESTYSPANEVKNITASELQALIAETKKFSLLFYKWRKVFLLRKHLDIYQKSICPCCGTKVKREKTGKRNRVSHFCPVCQIRSEGIAKLTKSKTSRKKMSGITQVLSSN